MTGPDFTELLQRHRKLLIIVFVLIIAGVLAFFAYDKYQRHQVERAAVLYSELSDSLASGNDATARASAETLIHDYSATPYASMARFYLARLDIDAKQDDKAEGQLLQLTRQADLPEGMQGLARSALARLYVDNGKNQQALELLQKPDGAFAAVDWELRGDAEAKLRHDDRARDDYEKAIAHLPASDPYVVYLQMKMANLGVS
ncbi:tetratricopeptide repeat protein [Acidithiobacillus sp. CV18-2]|uniref:Ancillary SecYEG translocon subunit n=1 Tax=Igneacidithiobacillus copahuensis TaxID=2724909 RepID=A0AAE2YR55_9PROT|nr:tetratricopeptide repeat protein [Igneacidithiobacillus copahuensis]MBU2753524.1 tetratricopeptide repeat protein [Acidithiobacillus sp. CV18-3]MBU2757142.1 tetratricopeptide repeat protein [Acidithiobacillus sp. BN09-2]MBU2776018.1 tetratricopeptide repeat protein [Acidithiobacillus sp. CV18-2]MBU2795909.1 tetratricopeptide repeat protein [Acidithiobacillus sp. VAN18-2]MBU2800305.1 tetratricopeptide repeat protein [Acidithiobacillus sp. VAN18-4]UTV79834.1 tetratricopeptide repeat protein 